MVDKEDHNKPKQEDDDFNYTDDFGDDLDLDEDPFAEDAHQETPASDTHSQNYEQANKSGGIVDFLKSYGIVILIVVVIGYYGLKNSLGVFDNSDTTQSTQVNKSADNSTKKSTTISSLPVLSNIDKDNKSTEATKVTVKDQATEIKDIKSPDVLAKTPEDKGSKDDKSASFDPLQSLTQVPSTSQDAKDAKDAKDPKEPSAAQSELHARMVEILNGSDKSVSADKLDNNVEPSKPAVSSINSMASTANTADTVALKQEIDDLKSKLNMLSQNVAKTEGQDAQAVTSNGELQQQMKQLLIYVQGVSKALGLLSNEVKKQKEVLASLVSKDVGVPVTKQSGKQGLTVLAVIPGRAWLKLQDGTDITVAVGDMLPGYGKVINIDYKKGEIVTDTGDVIRE